MKKKQRDNRRFKAIFKLIVSIVTLPFKIFQMECRVVGRLLLTVGGVK